MASQSSTALKGNHPNRLFAFALVSRDVAQCPRSHAKWSRVTTSPFWTSQIVLGLCPSHGRRIGSEEWRRRDWV
jgi:hypothetical protein